MLLCCLFLMIKWDCQYANGGFLAKQKWGMRKKVKKHLDKWTAHAYNIIWLGKTNHFFEALVSYY